MEIHLKLNLCRLVCGILIIPLIIFGQTNFFFYKGEKITMNIITDLMSVIFSESTTKSKARELLSKISTEVEIVPVTNVALPNFYELKLTVQKDISAVMSALQTEKEVIWTNPILERKGTEFKVYNRFVIKTKSDLEIEQIESLNQKHHVKLIRQSGTGRFTFELTPQSDLPVMDMSNLYYHELKAEWAMPDFIVPFEFYVDPGDIYFSHQWNFNQSSDCDIDAPEAWNRTDYLGKEVA